MPRTLPLLALSALAATAAGCAGAYHLTTPDQVAPAGEEATVVVRVERQEFWLLWLPVEDAAVRFGVGDLQPRAAFSDKMGYVGTTVPVPHRPGRYDMRVRYLDREGDEAGRVVPVYVWDPNLDVLAVDFDALPAAGSGQGRHAARALTEAAGGTNICYMTSRPVGEHADAHRQLREQGYPDGPILLWQRQRWHVVPGWRGVPRVVVESRLVSELPELKRRFPRLTVGIAGGAMAAEAYRQAGMTTVVVGSAGGGEEARRYPDWAALAGGGLP